MEDPARRADAAFAATIALHEQMRRHLDAVLLAARTVGEALAAGRTLLLFGNGGSASDAQHVAAELVGRFQRERAALSAIALTTDTSVLTSIANDDSYARVFARQIEALGRAGDVAMGISTSGESLNVLEALRVAKQRGLRTVALTGGDGGSIGRAADVHVNVPHASTARVQEVHRTLLHVMCELIEG
jgi:D-sedoheptulose 7-phosphate isomerase